MEDTLPGLKLDGNCGAFLILDFSSKLSAPVVITALLLGDAVDPNIGVNSFSINLVADFLETISVVLSNIFLNTNNP